MKIRFVVSFFALLMVASPGSSQSRWVHLDTETGKLIYDTSQRGDRILDFSHAGYMGGGVALSQVPDVLTIGPEKGVDDYTSRIQDAIDRVSSLPLNNGFRGAVRLLPGEYPCSGGIRIYADGVVLRGSGTASGKQSTIRMSGKDRHSAVVIGPGQRRREEMSGEGIRTKITDAYIPAEFAPNATQILLDRCSVEGDNIWFVATGARVPGPIVLLNCRFKGKGNIEGHHRWTTGMLVDNCQVPEGGINFMNRGSMGSGHGWGMAWAVAWNCTAKFYVNQRPPGTYNWVIGSVGESRLQARPFDKAPFLPEGTFDAHGTRVSPGSLYLSQLKERLGSQALDNIGYGQEQDCL